MIDDRLHRFLTACSIKSASLHAIEIPDSPVIPDPMIHTSASRVRGPSLPSKASGFASGAELVQKDGVGFSTGRPAGEWDST